MAYQLGRFYKEGVMKNYFNDLEKYNFDCIKAKTFIEKFLKPRSEQTQLILQEFQKSSEEKQKEE